MPNNFRVQRPVNQNCFANLFSFLWIQHIATAGFKLFFRLVINLIQYNYRLLGSANHTIIKSFGVNNGVDSHDNVCGVVDNLSLIHISFRMADDVLRQGIQGIADVIKREGDINLDFADVQTVMKDRGLAHMGIGRAKGEDKAEAAVKMAINSPLLETSIDGARGVLLNVTGGADLSVVDASQAAEIVREYIDEDAVFIYGIAMDESLEDEIVITVIATGFEERTAKPTPIIPAAPKKEEPIQTYTAAEPQDLSLIHI